MKASTAAHRCSAWAWWWWVPRPSRLPWPPPAWATRRARSWAWMSRPLPACRASSAWNQARAPRIRRPNARAWRSSRANSSAPVRMPRSASTRNPWRPCRLPCRTPPSRPWSRSSRRRLLPWRGFPRLPPLPPKDTPCIRATPGTPRTRRRTPRRTRIRRRRITRTRSTHPRAPRPRSLRFRWPRFPRSSCRSCAACVPLALRARWRPTWSLRSMTIAACTSSAAPTSSRACAPHAPGPPCTASSLAWPLPS